MSKASWIYRHHLAQYPPGTSLAYQLSTYTAILSLLRRIICKSWHYTVHTVRQYGALRRFSTNQLNLHCRKRLFYGLPPYSTVRCGALFFSTVRRFGAVQFWWRQNRTVRCGAVRFCTAPHRKKKTHYLSTCICNIRVLFREKKMKTEIYVLRGRCSSRVLPGFRNCFFNNTRER